MSWNEDGTVWVSVNQSLPSKLALEIMGKVDDYNELQRERAREVLEKR